MGELIDKFIHHFISSRLMTKTSAYLINIQQAPGETLRSYVQRFHDKSNQIPDPNEQVTIATFTNRLVAGVFNTEIYREYSQTLRELWQKIDKASKVKMLIT